MTLSISSVVVRIMLGDVPDLMPPCPLPIPAVILYPTHGYTTQGDGHPKMNALITGVRSLMTFLPRWSQWLVALTAADGLWITPGLMGISWSKEGCPEQMMKRVILIGAGKGGEALLFHFITNFFSVIFRIAYI